MRTCISLLHMHGTLASQLCSGTVSVLFWTHAQDSKIKLDCLFWIQCMKNWILSTLCLGNMQITLSSYLGRRKCSPLWLIHISMVCLASGWKRDYRCHNTFPSIAFLAYMYHEQSSPSPANVICFNAGNSKSIR